MTFTVHFKFTSIGEIWIWELYFKRWEGDCYQGVKEQDFIKVSSQSALKFSGQGDKSDHDAQKYCRSLHAVVILLEIKNKI